MLVETSLVHHRLSVGENETEEGTVKTKTYQDSTGVFVKGVLREGGANKRRAEQSQKQCGRSYQSPPQWNDHLISLFQSRVTLV